ncbi:NADH dehydrogenase subunit M [Anseongella ginsenosidimutans]|uniref:NADH dehydrogenase subunit M n=1 Tax=Anseongella ginsenosidimutans TaxID=496056 RepID=A0A4R3KQQ2_9SPHI|nr:NADH-quinone oxidoreductase subunit M [Anseongella ginsenosidimutans]QEC52828.1 NADH-quinone oxidoreductase subunit M [Anseongella ginsenosidimutans]TCS87210.1 NADH dehydrogenase subunit M [Anseongella ginsenosidimutans]
MNWLSIIIFLPVVFLVLILLLPARFREWYRYITLGTALLQAGIACIIYMGFDRQAAGADQFQFVEKIPWIHLSLGNLGKLEIDYFLGIDGLSAPLLILSAIVMVAAAISSWEIKDNLKGYFTLFLLMDAAIMGVFCALDFFLFYVFYELMLLPLYFLIGMWGGPRREYAALKFFLYTLFGSVFMLLVIVGLYFSVKDPVSGAYTFNMLHMMNAANFVEGAVFSPDAVHTILGVPARLLGFAVIFIAFAIKVPVVPFHTWLPDAHVEAPTPISIILAGLLLKIGGYGILRLCFGIFPDAAVHFSWFIGMLGVISILYGALNALAMKDLKKMIAYSSVSHMGFVLLGFASFTTEGTSGAVLQMVSHGILSTMLFFLVGVIYNRVHDRFIPNFRGLATHMPSYTAFVMIAFFASLGLPGFSAFIAEAFTLIGTFNSESVNDLLPRWMAIAGSLGILLSAAYFLWTLQRMFFGTTRFKGGPAWSTQLADLRPSEWALLLPMALLSLTLGIFPSLFFDLSNATLAAMVQELYETGLQQLNTLQY